MNSKAQTFILCLLVLPAWGSICVWAQTQDQRLTIAVLDFTLNLTIANPDAAERDQLPITIASDAMRAQAAQSDTYTLVQANADAQTTSTSRCTDDTCAAQIGKALGGQRVIRGQVTKVSALIWYVSVRMIDTQTATLLHQETVQFRGNIAEVMPRVIAIVWRRMNETL